MAKMVKCKTCGADIAKSAKVCPNCGAKQHIGAMISCVIISVIALILVFGVIVGSSTPQKVGNINDDQSTIQSPNPLADGEEDSKNVFGVGDQVSLNDVSVTLVSVTESTGGNYMSPDNGKIFVLCEFLIENNSKNDLGISSILSFEAYVDDYSSSMSLSATLSSDKPQLDGSVAAGKKMTGVIGYEASKDWASIEVRFTPNVWAGSDIVFAYAK